ncbi:cadmium resistance transporter [Natrarchaeobius chitinivorans]|uniref:Cadmium transporter n=1 Tax=Natrarchaeobius chitinivorans TaxID=1679083 RepID=A0A3N6M3Q3_NATCH|nr:cadmium resistance transporter [Natrarchaeobius chitinivorans]RQG98108.1 cadmium transporter [Natrarchaeobius chitinivorans]
METLFVAAGLFIATNIDILIVVTAFCLDEDYATVEVVVGYCTGFLVGLCGAVFGAFVVTGVLQRWAFLLGAVPVVLGLWGLFRLEPDPVGDELQVIPGPTGRIWVVTVTAIGLNGENLAVYIPFFVGLTSAELLAVILAYIIAAVILFLVALLITRLTHDLPHPAWIDRWLVPAVLVFVGSYVIISGWIAV